MNGMKWIVVEFVEPSHTNECSFDVTAYSTEEDGRKAYDEIKESTKVLIQGTVIAKHEKD